MLYGTGIHARCDVVVLESGHGNKNIRSVARGQGMYINESGDG